MKKYLSVIFASIVIMGGTALVSVAQTDEQKKPKSINERQENQRERIRNGVQNDEINRNELKRLAREQSQIRQMERRARSDGDVTLRERGRIQRQLNQSNRHIRRAGRN